MKQARLGRNLTKSMNSSALPIPVTTAAFEGAWNPALINTPLQRGGCRPAEILNRFNGFPRARKAVETVGIDTAPPGTSLKRGVNETRQFRSFRVLGLTLLLLLPCFANAAGPDPARLALAFTQLATYDAGQPADALLALDEAIAATNGDSSARSHIERTLIAVLNSQATVFAKQYVCRKLVLIGTRESVRALEPLLTNPNLSGVARLALERIPHPDSTGALRRALPKTTGSLKVGIINSLGAMADANATGDLVKLVDERDPGLAGAAAVALGQIGTPQAAAALSKFHGTTPGELHARVDEASLAAAENLLRHKHKTQAELMLRELFSEANGTVRPGAFRGLIAAEPDKTEDLLTQALRVGDEKLLNLITRIMAELPPEQAQRPLLRALGSLPARGQVAVLDSVQLRGDAQARPAVFAAWDSSEPQVRAAAVRALGRVGAPIDVPKLVGLAASDAGPEGAAARSALAALPGRENSAAILSLLAGSGPPVRVEAIRAAASRRATEAAPVLANFLTDPADPTNPVHRAALEALALLGDEGQVPPVIRSLRAAHAEPERARAEKTLASLVARGGPKTLDALLAGVTDLDPQGRVILLQQLATLGGPQAIAPVRAALTGGVPELREGAFRVLTVWPDWEAAPNLLKLAQTPEPPAWRAPAFRGYIRLCREVPMSPEIRLGRVSEGARLAQTTEDKLSVISVLAELPTAGSLKLLSSYLEDVALADAAALGIVKVAAELAPKNRVEAVPVLLQVLKASRNAEAQKQAKVLLKKLGVAVD